MRNSSIKSVLAVSLLTAWHLNALAATIADAESAVRRGDYATALPIYDSLATAGDVKAMVALARMYQAGVGVTKDLAQAIKLYTAAAERGDADAEFSLGNLYLLGEGVPQDDDWAFTYYRKAAQQGHLLAQKNLKEFYRSAGLEPPAADVSPPVNNGTETAMPRPLPPTAALPATTPSGMAIPPELSPDEVQAIENARARGILVDVDAVVPQAQRDVATLPAIRQQLSAGATEHTRAELETLANHGNAEAQYLLSQLLDTVPDGSASAAQSLAWLRLSAATGYAEAEYKLAERYLDGRGLPPDEAEAITWYRAAARHGHTGAQQRLDTIYEHAGISPKMSEPVTRPSVAPTAEFGTNPHTDAPDQPASGS